MAAKKTNWGAILGAIGILFVLWLLLSRKAAAAGSGGGGPIGGASGGGFGGVGGGPSGGGGGGSIPLGNLQFGGLGLGDRLKKFIQSVLDEGRINAAGLQVSSDYLPGLGETPGLSIPSVPVPGFGDLNDFLVTQDIPGYDQGDPGLLDETDLADQTISEQSFDWGGFSPSDFLVTSDIPQTADLSNYGIDPSYGSDTLQTTDPFNDSSSMYILDGAGPQPSYGYS